MKCELMVVTMLLASAVAAQQQPPAPASGISDQQPRVLNAAAVKLEADRPVKGWARSAAGAEDDSIVEIRAQGPGMRVTPDGDLSLFRSDWLLSGEYSVGATFQPAASSAVFGLTVGGEQGVTLMIGGDGRFAVRLVAEPGKASEWQPVGLRHAPDHQAPGTRVEVQVKSASVAFVVDGQTVQEVRIRPGDLDGRPGVFVAGLSDVIVSAFTVQTAIGSSELRRD